MKLNIGCGKFPRAGYINIDRLNGSGVDLRLDIEQELPFKDNSVDEIICFHVLEHLVKWEDTVKELHRVLKPNGVLYVRVPYGLDPYTGHIRTFMPYSFDNLLFDDAGSGLDWDEFKFIQADRTIHHQIPFKWHIKRYLHIDTAEYARFGRRSEIAWTLVKPPMEHPVQPMPERYP